MKLFMWTVVIFLLHIALFWYGGVDFLERGFNQAMALGFAVLISGTTYVMSRAICYDE